MSIKALSMVWERSKQSGSSLLMLLAIADYAKDDGSDAWPSLATLARKTRMSRRNAIEIIKKLEDEAELKIKRGAGPRGCNFYDITVPGEVQFTTKKTKEKVVKPDSPEVVNPSSPALVKPDSLEVVNPSSPESLSIPHLSVSNPSEGAGAKNAPPTSPDPLAGLPQGIDGHQQAVDKANGGNGADPVQEVAKHLRWLCAGRGAPLPRGEPRRSYIKAAKNLLDNTDATDWQNVCTAIDDWSENPPGDDQWWRDKTRNPHKAIDHLTTHYWSRKNGGGTHARRNGTELDEQSKAVSAALKARARGGDS